MARKDRAAQPATFRIEVPVRRLSDVQLFLLECSANGVDMNAPVIVSGTDFGSDGVAGRLSTGEHILKGGE